MKFVVLITALVFLHSCVVIEEEVRPKRHTEVKKKVVKKKEEKKVAKKKGSSKGKFTEYLSPLKGKPIKEGRGFFITSSCKKFFRAVEAGKAIYVGRDLKAYGWTVIVEQKDGLVSVYTRTGELFVHEGEKVRRRQVLGRVGRKKGRCGIYFEVRDRKGKPVKVRLR